MNQTEEFHFSSILYGGSSSTMDPENQISNDQLKEASKQVFDILRKYNPLNGIYMALGPHDTYQMNY